MLRRTIKHFVSLMSSVAVSYFLVFDHISSKPSIIAGSACPRVSGEAKGLLKSTPLKNF